MTKRVSGQVLELERKCGRTYALRFRAYGKRRYLTLGTVEEGWSRPKAEEELENVLADVRRGIWRPPESSDRIAEPQPDPIFHQFASEWLEGLSHEGLAENTLAEYGWELSNHLLPFFASHRLSEIAIADVDAYRQQKVGEGRLSATSINKTITRLAQILEVAVERELILRNPARGRRRRLKQRAPIRTWLDSAEQIEALLLAAGQLDAEGRGDRRDSHRRALLATLALAGLRIGEALEIRWRDVDLSRGRLHVQGSKTDAGIRGVDLVPALREELSEHKARARFGGVDDFVFSTATGARQNPSNARNRVLAPSIQRANENLTRHNKVPLPQGLTPHSLRRTYISMLLAVGEEVPYVMRQVGHSDPKVTLSIYAQVMSRAEDERSRLKALLEGSDWALLGTEAVHKPPVPGEQLPLEPLESRSDAGTSDYGRYWARTSDLLLVRQALSQLS